MLPGRTEPGRFDRKMCNASVDPMPSRISRPKRARKRSNSDAGSGSPAETAYRTEANESSGTSLASNAA